MDIEYVPKVIELDKIDSDELKKQVAVESEKKKASEELGLVRKKAVKKVYKGFIQIPRNFQDTPLWKNCDGNTLKVYLYCLMSANRRQGKSKIQLDKYLAYVGHGQFVTGRFVGAKSCGGMSPTTFKKKLGELEQLGVIKQEVRKKNRIVTVCNLNDFI
jgi:hypothetical protein